MAFRRRHFILILSLAILFVGTILSWEINTNFGTTRIENVNFSTAEGIGIIGQLYIPAGTSAITPKPGILVIHGFSSSKEGMMAFNIELARHGFVVLAIDVAGHGYSDPGAGLISDRGGLIALEYLAGRPFVNTVGIVGHSMGAWMAVDILNSTAISVQATVLVGGGVDTPYGILGANTSYPFNLLVAIGRFDELFYGVDLTALLAPSFGTMPPIIIGQTYGNTTSGTGRRLITPPTNHLFEVFDSTVISETVQWFTTCLQDGDPFIPIFAGVPIYSAYFAGEAMATIGLILTIFPLLLMLMQLSLFRSLSHAPTSSYGATRQRYLKLGLVYAIIGLGTFLPFVLIGTILQFIFLFPQVFAPAIGSWLLGSALLAAGVLRLLRHRDIHSKPTWKDYGGFEKNQETFKNALAKSALLSFLIILWMYLWSGLLQFFFHINFQVIFPFFKPLTPIRALFMPIYLLFAIPFFVIEGLWISGILRVKPKSSWIYTQTSWTLHAVFIKTVPYIIVVGLQFAVAYTVGILLFPGYIGFMLLFLWGLIPLFLITPIILTWSYRISNQIYIGALIDALILCWSLAATFAIL